MSSPPINDCPLPGHILLLLLPNREFGLHIPIQDALQLCTRPLKYLRYLAWVVLHLEGKITCNSVEVDEEKGTFEDQQTYRFEPGPLRSWDDARPINAEIADRRSSSATNSSRLHEFADNLRERDISCVFTGYTFAEAMHIVPFSKGNEWLERLVGGRFPGRSTNEGEDLGELDINHVSNGFLTFSGIHMCTDRRVAAVIVTPNRVLSCDDIPPSLPRLFERPTGIEYPTGIRYTFQWLHATGRSNDELRAVPNNSDAAFNSASEQRRPSPFLLECMYAATVVKFWGLHPDRLRMHPKFISAPPRKSRPSLGFKPTRSSDRSITIGKPNRFRQNSAGAMGGPSDASMADEDDMAPDSGHVDSDDDGPLVWHEEDDPWDYILKLSYLFPASQARLAAQIKQREVEEEEQRARLASWLEGLSTSEDIYTPPAPDASGVPMSPGSPASEHPHC